MKMTWVNTIISEIQDKGMRSGFTNHLFSPSLPLSLIGVVSILLLLTSCGAVKYEQIILFEDMENEQKELQRLPEIRIQEDDILNIEVASRNPETVQAFQQYGYSGGGQQGQQQQGATGLALVRGYRVDELGLIYMPFIGAIPVIGMRLSDIRTVVQNRLREYIPDATIQVRLASFRITILGEVGSPGSFNVQNEKISILDAIALAGDLSDYAERDEVLLVRERNGVRESVRLNVQDKEIFESPYFYLKPNDFIYVEPMPARAYTTNGDWWQRYGPYFFSALTIVTFILTRI